MKHHNRMWKLLLVLLLPVLFFSSVMAQDNVPDQIDLAVANLSQRMDANITVTDLTQYEWFRQEFADTSLGCPSPGQMYAQVLTTGYQFLLTYDDTVYDYRVAESGEPVILCDTYPAMPTEPTPTAETPTSPCGDQYTVEAGDRLLEIAEECNTTVASLMVANPDIPNRDLIFTGQVLNIPADGMQRSVSIRPYSGPPGSTVTLFASGFPPGAQVQLGFGPPQSEYEVVATREIAADGELTALLQIPTWVAPSDELVAVVALNFEETISEVFTVTEGQPTPVPTATEPADNLFTETQIYLVAVGDEGRSGQLIGCGDSLVPVTVTFEPTIAPLTAALEELFAIDTRTYGQSGLYNAFYQSDIAVEGIEIDNGEAIINLSGTLFIGGVCDEPRILAQVEQTALQYYTIDSVSVFLNGEPLAESM